MKLSRIASYVFLGSLFGVVMIWGYFPRVWVMSWPQMSLLGLAAAGLVAWFVFSLDSLRLWLKKRSTQFAIGLAITAVMSLVLLGTMNWLATTYNFKKDLTQNQFHTLSDQTRKIAEGLKENITIRIWSTGVDRMSSNMDMRRFLENYETAGKGKIKVEIKNPNEDRPGSAADNVKRDNVIIVRSASGREARVENFTDTKGEELLTNALVQAIKGRKKTICFLSGHGELDLNSAEAQGLSQLKTQLTSSTYEAKEVALATAEKLPDECEMLVVAGPRSEALEREMHMIRGYLSAGGKMMALMGPGVPAGWRKFAAEYGVSVRADVVIDPRVQPPIAIATKNFAQDVDIVHGFNRLVIFPETSSIEVSEKSVGNETVKTFISSESYTFAKAGDIKNLKSVRPAASDMRGPLPVAVLVTKPLSAPEAPPAPLSPKTHETKKPAPHALLKKFSLVSEAYAAGGEGDDPALEMDEAPATPGSEVPKDGPKAPKTEMSLIVVGNHNFAMNSFVAQMGNSDLFLNSVNFLMKDQDLIGIRPREIRQAALELSAESLRQVYATVLLIAGLFLVGGITATRRKNAID